MTRFASLVLVFSWLPCANAQQLTYRYDGIVEIPSPFLGDNFPVGTPVSGQFTIDPSTADLAPGDPTLGSYVGSVSSIDVQVGDYVAISSFAGDIEVRDSDEIFPFHNIPHRDHHFVTSLMTGDDINGYPLFLASLQLIDVDGDALMDDLISVPTSFDQFSDPWITIDFEPVGTSQNRVWARLENLTLVPEPTGLGLSALLLAMPIARRRVSA